jgi:hypothetical protein
MKYINRKEHEELIMAASIYMEERQRITIQFINERVVIQKLKARGMF